MHITTYDIFEKFIEQDQKQKPLNIIRFINVESLSGWVKVKNYLISRCPNQVRLSSPEYSRGNDLIPNMNKLLRDLKQINCSTVVLPLSEHLRINTDSVSNVLSNIVFLQFQNDVITSNIRLYIPLYKMKNSLNDLIRSNDRLKNSIIFLDAEEDDDYSLTIISKEIDAKIAGNNIVGIRKYLEYWEDNPSQPIILHTNNAKYYKNGTFRENVKVLVTAFDIIEYHNLIGRKVVEEWGIDWQWRDLLSRLKNIGKIDDLFNLLFGINKYNEITLLSKWKKSGDFDRWLIWLWTKFDCQSEYLNSVAEKTGSFSEFISCIVENIFNYDFKDSNYKKIFGERKLLIKAIGVDTLTTQFWDRYSQLSNQEKLRYLTDCTIKEKIEFVELLSKIGIGTRTKDVVKDAFPHLYGYIREFTFENEEFTKYFNEYKYCKLQNFFSDDFVNEVNSIAQKKGSVVWKALNSRTKLVGENYDNNTIIFWVDNLGVDSLGLIQHTLNEEYKSIYYIVDVGYSSIPSITEHNKDFFTNRQYMSYKDGALDKLKHAGEYPDYIVSEIDIILDVINIAVNELETYKKVIITSDHGSSRGAVIAKGKTYDSKPGAQVYRHGRYCIDSENQYENEVPPCFDIDSFHIMGNYERFSIGGNIKGEIHGGATLEEILVPVVMLSKSPFEETANIDLLTPTIKPQENVVRFKVDKEYTELFATVNGKKYKCHRDKDEWYFTPDIGKEEEYIAIITSRGDVGKLTYKVNKGRLDNKKFDI